jgi:hypothetical protein
MVVEGMIMKKAIFCFSFILLLMSSFSSLLAKEKISLSELFPKKAKQYFAVHIIGFPVANNILNRIVIIDSISNNINDKILKLGDIPIAKPGTRD